MAIELPTDAQQILDASDPQQFAGANNGPVTPGTNLPLPPNAAQNAQSTQGPVAPPDIAPSNSPGSLADKISAAFLTHLAARQPAPPPNSEAGRAVSAAQRVAGAANGVMTSLSDASHATDVKGGGWLSGVTSTLAARQQRIAQTNQQQFENAEAKRKNDALIARNQVETLQIARNIQHADEEDQLASAARGKSYVDAMRANHGVEDNITQTDLNSRVQKNQKYLETHYARITGYEPILDGEGNQKIDASGRPVVSPLWSLVDRQPLHPDEQHQVTQADHDEWLRNTGVEYPVGTKLSVDQFTALSGRSHALADTENLVNKDREISLSDEQRKQLRADLSDGNVQHYIAMVPGSALGGLYAASKNADAHIAATQQQIQAAQAKGDQNSVQQLQSQLKNFQDEAGKVNRVISSGFSDDDRDKYQKNIEKERHDQAEEKRQNLEEDRKNREDAAKKAVADGDVSSAAEALRRGTLDPSQLSKRSATYQSILDEADRQEFQETGQHFNVAQAQTDYKYANQPRTKDTLNLINGITEKDGSLDIVKQRAAKLPQLNSSTLNKVFSRTKAEFGDPALTDFQTAMLGFADEYSKVMGGGVSSDTGRQQALDILKQGYSKGQMAGAFQTLQADIDARKRGIIGNNRYLKQEYGDPAQQQNSTVTKVQLPPAAVQQLKEGVHTTFANGQTWMLQNGKPVQVRGQQ
jgi:hypothetical protein